MTDTKSTGELRIEMFFFFFFEMLSAEFVWMWVRDECHLFESFDRNNFFVLGNFGANKFDEAHI